MLLPYEYTINPGGITIDKYIGLGGSVTIPSTIEAISVVALGDEAFQNCTVLTDVTIPASVNSIGNRVFWGCTGLTSITVDLSNLN